MKLNKETLRNIIIEELEQKLENGELTEQQLEEFLGGTMDKLKSLGQKGIGAAKGMAQKAAGAMTGANKWKDGSAINKQLDFGEKALSVRKKVHTILNRQQVATGLETLKGDMSGMQPMMQARVMAILINKLGLDSNWFKKNQSRIRSDLEKGAKTAAANVGGTADARFKTGSRGGSKDKGGSDLAMDDTYLDESSFENTLEEIIREELANIIKKN